MKSNALQKLLSLSRKAIADYNMIESGDRIAVGVSGGKDSLALLTVLAAYKRFCPEPFELTAITIDLGFKGADFSGIASYIEELNVPFHLVRSDIAEILFEIRKEKNPCSLCSKMRRGALNTKLTELNCNKLALGHHLNDLTETFLLSAFFEGRLSTFQPVSYMDRSGVTLVRPFLYVEEKHIKSLAPCLPVQKNPCPADHHTQREYMKNLIKTIQKDIPFAFDRLSSAILSPERYNLLPQKPKEKE